MAEIKEKELEQVNGGIGSNEESYVGGVCGYNNSEIVGTPNYPSPILEHGKNGKPTLVIDD